MSPTFLVTNSANVRVFSQKHSLDMKSKRILSHVSIQKQLATTGRSHGPACPRLIIIDWDDTLNPSSWCMKNGVLTVRPPFGNEISTLRELSLKVAATLQKCLENGLVVIVTNAETGWVEMSAKMLLPDVSRLLSHVPVISARSSFESIMRDAPTMWKALTFGRLISEWFETFGREAIVDDIILEVVSIGDSEHEREALHHVSFHHEVKFVSKSIKLLERPTIEEMKKQHDALVDKLDTLLSSAVPVDVCYYCGELSDHPTSRSLAIPIRRPKLIRGVRFRSPPRPSFSRG